VKDERALTALPPLTNDEPAITILHLSDVQFGKHHRFADEGGGFGTLLQRLCDDLDLLKRENGLVPDLVALTGDLAEWGMKREFEQVAEFSEGLLRHLQLEPERLLVVPGNHDINRSLCEAYFKDCEGEGEAPKPPYWRKWKPFVELINRLYLDHNVEGYRFTELEPWTLFEIPLLKVVIAGLNSTIHESHRDADHHGFVGEAQLRWFRDRLREYENKGWLRVGLVHHNAVRRASVDDENLKDTDDLREHLGELLHVLLHGHTHQGRIEMIGPSLPVIATGSAAVKRDQRPGPSPDQPGETPNQYQLVRFTRTGLWCAAREYTYERKRWIGDTRVSKLGDRWWYSLDRTWSRAEATFPPPTAGSPGQDTVALREPWESPWQVVLVTAKQVGNDVLRDLLSTAAEQGAAGNLDWAALTTAGLADALRIHFTRAYRIARGSDAPRLERILPSMLSVPAMHLFPGVPDLYSEPVLEEDKYGEAAVTRLGFNFEELSVFARATKFLLDRIKVTSTPDGGAETSQVMSLSPTILARGLCALANKLKNLEETEPAIIHSLAELVAKAQTG
jgi:3',5'-cyclic AMP phosphodiesterase CpdA